LRHGGRRGQGEGEYDCGSHFRFSILGLVAAGHGAAAVNTKHQFLISSQLANQFNLDLDWAPRHAPFSY
jgi:hypothetical protein